MKRISRKVSEETKEKMSLAKKGNKNPRYNQRVTTETRKKISDSMKKYWENIPY